MAVSMLLATGTPVVADVILSATGVNDTLKKMQRLRQTLTSATGAGRGEALFQLGVEADGLASVINDEVAAHGSQDKALIDLAVSRTRELGVVITYNAGKKKFFYDNAAFREYLGVAPRSAHAAEAAFKLIEGDFFQATATDTAAILAAAERKRVFLRQYRSFAAAVEVHLMNGHAGVDHADQLAGDHGVGAAGQAEVPDVRVAGGSRGQGLFVAGAVDGLVLGGGHRLEPGPPVEGEVARHGWGADRVDGFAQLGSTGPDGVDGMADPKPLPFELDATGGEAPVVLGRNHHQHAEKPQGPFDRAAARVGIDIGSRRGRIQFKGAGLTGRDGPGRCIGAQDGQLVGLGQAVVDPQPNPTSGFRHDGAGGEVTAPIRTA